MLPRWGGCCASAWHTRGTHMVLAPCRGRCHPKDHTCAVGYHDQGVTPRVRYRSPDSVWQQIELHLLMVLALACHSHLSHPLRERLSYGPHAALHGSPATTYPLQVHCTAPFRLIQAAAPYMRDAGKQEMSSPGGEPRHRAIINISSTTGGLVGGESDAHGKSSS